MNLLRKKLTSFKWGLLPHCKHREGYCISEQGIKCKIVKNTRFVVKSGVKIQRTVYTFIGD